MTEPKVKSESDSASPNQNPSGSSSPAVSTSNMCALRLDPPKNFDFEPKSWPNWIENFERFRSASGLSSQPQPQQIDTLIYVMGFKANSIAKSFTYTASEDKEKYDTVKSKFDAHFLPHKNVIHERYLFYTRAQKPGESAEDFITALYKLAETCEFESMTEATIKDEMIRDRIVVGVTDGELSKKLQLTPKLTVSKAVELVRTYEDVQQQQQVQRSGTTAPQQIDQVRSQRRSSNSSNSCSRCGGNCRSRTDCPARNAECHQCGIKGHYASFCRTGTSSKGPSSERNQRSSRKSFNRSPNRRSSRRPRRVQHLAEREGSDVDSQYDGSGYDTDSFHVGSIHQVGSNETDRDDEWNAILKMGSKFHTFELDTGAYRTVVPLSYRDPKYKMYDPDVMLESANKPLDLRGMQYLPISSKHRTTEQKVYLAADVKKALLGRNALSALGLVKRVHATSVAKKELPEVAHESLFHGLGIIQGKCTIFLATDAKPFAVAAPRRVPLPLHPKVKQKLDQMHETGVITPITEPTDWVAPIVVVYKPNKSIRLCIDYSQLNKFVKREYYPLPPVEETLAKLAGAVHFSKLDANSGYYQIELDEESKKLTTFITPFGRYYFNRLPMGISCAPEIFQYRMTKMLEGLEHVVCHMDDILVWGSTIEEHDQNLLKVLERIKDAKMTLNREKCVFRVPRLKFLGHIIERGKINADPEKTSAVVEMQPPRNKQELQSLLGSLNFLARHIPNRSENLEPLHDLLRKDRIFKWDAQQTRAFNSLKQTLSSPPVLAIYDPSRSTIVSSDASSYGLGAVLLQLDEKNVPRPVAFASRTLTAAEKRYAQIEKEALGIAWACEKFKYYIIGLEFVIETDHKPLIPILSTKFIEDLTPRLQRIRLRLLRYTYTIRHIPGKDLVTADILSRKPVNSPTAADFQLEDEIQTHAINAVKSIPATSRMLTRIQNAQQSEAGRKLRDYISNGWPKSRHEIPEELSNYWQYQGSLSFEKGLILYAKRLWIPPPLRRELLDRLHESHSGITKSITRAQTSIWWPKINSDIEDMVKDCQKCATDRPNRSEPLITTPLPAQPWQKIAVDLMKFESKWYLVIMDYYSKFLEISSLRRLTTGEVRRKLEAVFARFGIPEILFTDNGTQLTSSEMQDFADEADFQIVTRSPSYPQANGQAEAGVKIAKKLLANEKPWIALLNYRATPTALGYSPAELLMKRKLRTRIPEFSQTTNVSHKAVAEKHQTRREQMERQFNRSKGAVDLPELKQGREVWVDDINQRATVVRKRAEPRSYDVRLNNGGIIRRNRKNLRALPSTSIDFPASSSAAPSRGQTPTSTSPSTPARSSPRHSSPSTAASTPSSKSPSRVSQSTPPPKTPSTAWRSAQTPVVPYETRFGRATHVPSKYRE